MICLILLIIINCKSTNYYELAGVKNELFTTRQGNNINDISNHRINDRINNNDKEEEITNGRGELLGVGETWLLSKEKEVKKVEDMQSIVTALGSAIAGIYCLIKTIMNAIKKVKKN